MKVRAYFRVEKQGPASLLAVFPVVHSAVSDLLVSNLGPGDWFYEDYDSLELLVGCVDSPKWAVYDEQGFVEETDACPGSVDFAEPCEVVNLKDVHKDYEFYRKGDYFIGIPKVDVITKKDLS